MTDVQRVETTEESRRRWVQEDVNRMSVVRVLVGYQLVEFEGGMVWRGKEVTWKILKDLPETELFDAPWHFSTWLAWDTVEESERRNREFEAGLELGKIYKGFIPLYLFDLS